tara:strand:+ start:21351 stop:22166 length:816 start_codon:yes stop_codon:yes gene_type:complete
MQRSSVPLWQVDAFTDKPFAGNPAAVCLLRQFPADQWMQDVAAEMNLAETAFVVPRNQPNVFDLRWFTPVVEADLCGHATLAAAHVLCEQSRINPSAPIRFQTRSGELTCQRSGQNITLDFPATPPDLPVDDVTASQVADIIGGNAEFIARSSFDVFVVAKDERFVRDFLPDFKRIAEIETRGVIVTAKSDQEGIDYLSRLFAPRHGINEDPVTGSTHCALGPYWAGKLGRDDLVGYQASKRGGTIRTKVMGDRVLLTGQAVSIMEAKLFV